MVLCCVSQFIVGYIVRLMTEEGLSLLRLNKPGRASQKNKILRWSRFHHIAGFGQLRIYCCNQYRDGFVFSIDGARVKNKI